MAHHRQCTHKITVADISRAKDDRSLRDNLAEGYARRGGGGTMLVLTRGDSIDDDTEVTGTIGEKRKEQQLRKDLKALRDQRKQLNAQKRKVGREEGLDLMDEIDKVAQEIKAKDHAFQALCVGMRNSSVVKAVSDQYRDMTGDPKALSAFVVGNDAYKKHQAGYDIDERPLLSVEQTGIPALRARLYVLPAEGKLNDALHMANSQIPNMINLIELYCGKTHFARKSEIEALILEPREKLHAHFHGIKQRLEDAMLEWVLKPMLSLEPKWSHESRKRCQRWASPDRYLTTHLPLMKNNGFRKGTKKKPEVNWNKELLSHEGIKNAMDTFFSDLHNELLPILVYLKNQLISHLMDTRRSIKADPQSNVMALNQFLEAFMIERGSVQNLISKAFREIRAGVDHIHVDATQASATSYLVRAMAPIYAEVIKVKGRGAPAKRMELFEKRVASMSGIWMAIHDKIAKAFSLLVKQQMKIVEDGMNEIISGIHNKFNILCDNTEVKDAKEKLLEEELREKLQKAIIQAKDLLEGPIHEAADECSKYSTRKKENSLFVGDDESSNGG